MFRKLLLLAAVSSCDGIGGTGDELTPQHFAPYRRSPAVLTPSEMAQRADMALPHERRTAPPVQVTTSYGESILVVASDRESIAITDDGKVVSLGDYWEGERVLSEAHFGKMTHQLFDDLQLAKAAGLSDVEVQIQLEAYLLEPQLPYDGRDQQSAISDFEGWSQSHAQTQQMRIASAKQGMRAFLVAHGAIITVDDRGFPLITARVPLSLLESQELNSPSVIRISRAQREPGHLLGYAGHASMLANQLVGGTCGALCDGGLIDVGLWEVDGGTIRSGLARNNSTISQGSIMGYLNQPAACSIDTDCTASQPSDVMRSCQQIVAGGPKICVQDHLTWVAGSVGMYGSYNYSTGIPTGSLDPTPNVPSGSNFGSSGAWRVDQRVGNDSFAAGLNYLITATPPTPYVNRSVSSPPQVEVDTAARTYGTFITVASGNDGTSSQTSCGGFRNGLCVGSYDYKTTYNDQSTHRVSTFSSSGNQVAYGYERPHLVGPGNHLATSGLHLPHRKPSPGVGTLQHATDNNMPIQGTSFSAPAILGAAITAHQYEGWFSALAFPMVNKAVLLASTIDANADGAIGTGFVWSGQVSDAQDGVGQINQLLLRQVLDGNRYWYRDMVDSDFVSCGTNCREYVVGSIAIPANSKARVAMAWHACPSQLPPQLNNELALVLNCGKFLPGVCGGGTVTSNAPFSEIEVLERGSCTFVQNCSIRIRINNGAALNACGSTVSERVGVAWSFR